MKITAGGTSSDSNSDKATIIFTPPELLIDTPFNMGCYNLSNVDSFQADEQYIDMSPASCILTCAEKGQSHRHAGIQLLLTLIGGGGGVGFCLQIVFHLNTKNFAIFDRNFMKSFLNEALKCFLSIHVKI